MSSTHGDAQPRRYPTDVSRVVRTRDGLTLVIRSIRYDDVDALARFHATLSEETVRRRYFHAVALHARIAPSRLGKICRPDADCEAVLLAVRPAEAPGEPDEVIGVGRLEQVSDKLGEIAVLVGDRWQHHGVGGLLLEAIIDVARGHGLRKVNAYILRENEPMQTLCAEHGFTVTPTTSGLVRAERALEPVS